MCEKFSQEPVHCKYFSVQNSLLTSFLCLFCFFILLCSNEGLRWNLDLLGFNQKLLYRGTFSVLSALCVGNGTPWRRKKWHHKSLYSSPEHDLNWWVRWCHTDSNFHQHYRLAFWQGIWGLLCEEWKGKLQGTYIFLFIVDCRYHNKRNYFVDIKMKLWLAAH